MVSTAPVAPIGWPCAIAPPSTLTTSSAQSKLAVDRNGYRSESLVDLDAVDVADLPAARDQGLPDGRYRAQAEHARVRPRRRRTRPGAPSACRPFFSAHPALGNDHRRGAAVEPGRIAGGDRAILAEGGAQLGEALERRLGAVVLVLLEQVPACSARTTRPARSPP